jgi:hypothetical protein
MLTRFVSTGFLYEDLDIEGTDLLPQYWTQQEDSMGYRITSTQAIVKFP